MESKPVSKFSLWSLLEFLSPGFLLELLHWLPLMRDSDVAVQAVKSHRNLEQMAEEPISISQWTEDAGHQALSMASTWYRVLASEHFSLCPHPKPLQPLSLAFLPAESLFYITSAIWATAPLVSWICFQLHSWTSLHLPLQLSRSFSPLKAWSVLLAWFSLDASRCHWLCSSPCLQQKPLSSTIPRHRHVLTFIHKPNRPLLPVVLLSV